MLEIIKSFFSPVGGGRTSFASQNGNIQRKQFPYENYNGKEDLRQEYNNSSSNSDFNRKRGEEYLKSSYGRFADGSNASVLISSSFTSENIVGGGQLRSTSNGCELVSRPKVNASSRSIKGKRAYAHFKGGEGNYTSLMSSDFAGTETMLNPGNASFWNVDVSSRSNHIVGGGGEIHLDSSSKKRRNKVASQKGGKPFSRLASYTRNDLQKGGAGLTVCAPFYYEGGVC